jgi:hypothetical protein
MIFNPFFLLIFFFFFASRKSNLGLSVIDNLTQKLQSLSSRCQLEENINID